jgi:TetR/AcrR family transcriptional regulator
MNAPTDTPTRILEVAREFFAERGYEGTTVRDIAVAAEANLAAVGYHFGSKQGLYQDVLRSQVGPLDLRIQAVCRSASPPLARLEAVVRAVFEHIRMRPQMPAIMVREMASGRELNAVLVGTFRQLLPVITGVIVEGQRDRTIRSGDPVLLTLSLIAQPIYFSLARPLLAAIAGLEVGDPATAERMADHAAAVIRAGFAGPRSAATDAEPTAPRGRAGKKESAR